MLRNHLIKLVYLGYLLLITNQAQAVSRSPEK